MAAVRAANCLVLAGHTYLLAIIEDRCSRAVMCRENSISCTWEHREGRKEFAGFGVSHRYLVAVGSCRSGLPETVTERKGVDTLTADRSGVDSLVVVRLAFFSFSPGISRSL